MYLTHTIVVFTTVLALQAVGAGAEEVQVAVAANFSAPMQKIAAAFEKESGIKLQMSFGATGKFRAQIENGAPFEVLLAADQETAEHLVKQGLGVAGSQFTYAIGKLVLWSPTPGLVDEAGAVLRNPSIHHIAYCNPKLAPYGAAAVETLSALGLFETLKPRLVEGENISQAYQFVVSGNAEIGFVALSQVTQEGRLREGSAWIVPAGMYAPLRQDAVLLDKGKAVPAASRLLQFLKSESARTLMRNYGYTF